MLNSSSCRSWNIHLYIFVHTFGGPVTSTRQELQLWKIKIVGRQDTKWRQKVRFAKMSGLWCLMPLSTIFQLYGGSLKWQYIGIVNRSLDTNIILYGRIDFFFNHNYIWKKTQNITNKIYIHFIPYIKSPVYLVDKIWRSYLVVKISECIYCKH